MAQKVNKAVMRKYFGKPWFLQPWFIGLLFGLWFLIVPAIIGLILIVIDIKDNHAKMKRIQALNLDGLITPEVTEHTPDKKINRAEMNDPFQEALAAVTVSRPQQTKHEDY